MYYRLVLQWSKVSFVDRNSTVAIYLAVWPGTWFNDGSQVFKLPPPKETETGSCLLNWLIAILSWFNFIIKYIGEYEMCHLSQSGWCMYQTPKLNTKFVVLDRKMLISLTPNWSVPSVPCSSFLFPSFLYFLCLFYLSFLPWNVGVQLILHSWIRAYELDIHSFPQFQIEKNIASQHIMK